MTLSSPAEHEASRRADASRDELERAVRPLQTARAAVQAIEGTREEPATVTDPEATADEIAEDVAADARRKASSWGLGSAGEQLAEEMGDRAGGLALEIIRESPCIEVSG